MYIPANKIKEYREAHNPGLCPILSRPLTKSVVDHDHRTGEVRGIIDFNANNLLGVIERKYYSYCSGKPKDLPRVLRAIANFLERPPTGHLHPVGLNQLVAKFRKKNKQEQIKTLNMFYFVDKSTIKSCNNLKDRVKLYRTLLKQFYETKVTKHTERVECSENSIQQIR
tara:strand:- start:17632 stop:18138 length:507 start_codon:yes stop_codon:yes gene_type:complete